MQTKDSKADVQRETLKWIGKHFYQSGYCVAGYATLTNEPRSQPQILIPTGVGIATTSDLLRRAYMKSMRKLKADQES